jgi:hypothetical protein
MMRFRSEPLPAPLQQHAVPTVVGVPRKNGVYHLRGAEEQARMIMIGEHAASRKESCGVASEVAIQRGTQSS